MDAQLYAQLAQTVLIANSTGVNDDGELLYGTAVSYPARVVGKNTWTKGPNGENLFSSKQLILSATADVRINSRIYLDGETTSADPGWVPVGLSLRVGESGSSDHWKAWLGG